MIPQVDLFSFVFWKNLKIPKRHFEINWPLGKAIFLSNENSVRIRYHLQLPKRKRSKSHQNSSRILDEKKSRSQRNSSRIPIGKEDDPEYYEIPTKRKLHKSLTTIIFALLISLRRRGRLGSRAFLNGNEANRPRSRTRGGRRRREAGPHRPRWGSWLSRQHGSHSMHFFP